MKSPIKAGRTSARTIHNARIPTRPLSITLLVLLLAGCTAILGPEKERQVGAIQFHFDLPAISVPESAAVGESFLVTIQTYGGGCLDADDPEVSIDGLQAIITPYVIRTGGCADDLKLIDHEIALSFSSAGVAILRFRGLSQPDGSQVEVVRQVEIR